jgi:hypothetical protein
MHRTQPVTRNQDGAGLGKPGERIRLKRQIVVVAAGIAIKLCHYRICGEAVFHTPTRLYSTFPIKLVLDRVDRFLKALYCVWFPWMGISQVE